MEIPALFKEKLLTLDITPFTPLLETEVYNTIQLEVQEGKTDFSMEEYAELVGFRFQKIIKEMELHQNYTSKHFESGLMSKGRNNNFLHYP